MIFLQIVKMQQLRSEIHSTLEIFPWYAFSLSGLCFPKEFLYIFLSVYSTVTNKISSERRPRLSSAVTTMARSPGGKAKS